MLKLRHIPNAKLYVSEPDPRWFGNPSNEPKNPSWGAESKNWLKSRFHFSFAEYSNHRNSNFGVLRVMNDDFVQPDRGFGTHGHANMEIVTYIVDGKLTHKDSMGTEETLGRGSVQFMTAGRGVRHSEFNLQKDKPLRFIQTWIVPRRSGLNPNYGSFNPSNGGDHNGSQICTARNQWRHLVSDIQDNSTITPVQIEQDANLFVAELDIGSSLTFQMKKNRMAYILCAEGCVRVGAAGCDDVLLYRHDGCEVTPISITVEGSDEMQTLIFETVKSESSADEKGGPGAAHILVFEMENVPGAGRRDF